MKAPIQPRPSRAEDLILATIKTALASVASTTAKVREIRKARAKVEGGRP